jgi:hypothetical protein
VGINVQLRRETGEVLAEVIDSKMVLARATQQVFSGTRLLKYVVPWGDAVFNQSQARDLEVDIADVKRANDDAALLQVLAEVERLVQALTRETHVYLWFVGD